MADSRDQKWQSILKLALSVGSDVAGEHRSKPSFAAGDGAVGLAIVASLSEEPPSYRSEPIRIAAVVTKPGLRAAASRKDEGAERSESYTRVISYLGGNRVKKRVYFGVGDGDGEGGLLLEPPSPPEDPPFVVAEYLRFCFVCKKQLDGLDVYMYRYSTSSIPSSICSNSQIRRWFDLLIYQSFKLSKFLRIKIGPFFNERHKNHLFFFLLVDTSRVCSSFVFPCILMTL